MPSQLEEHKTREFSLSDLHLDCGPLRLGDASADAEKVPVQMLIRSHEGVERWGETWHHDFTGMRRKERVPIDYQHDPDVVIGYLDTFEVKRDGLHASGYLVPFDQDVTMRIIHLAKAGVPFESSIYFGGNGMRIEEVSANAEAEVNGRQVNGPAVIFREWPLRGVAVCPYGADGQTRTKLSNESTIRIPVSTSEENSMTKEIANQTAGQADEPLTKKGFLAAISTAFGFGDAAAGGDAGGDVPDESTKLAGDRQDDAGADAGGEEKPAALTAADWKAQMKRFSDAFGEEGPKLFAEELSFEEAAVRVIGALQEQNADLEKRLSAVDRGDTEGAEFNAGDDDGAKASAKDVANYGENLAPLVAMNARKLGGRN